MTVSNPGLGSKTLHLVSLSPFGKVTLSAYSSSLPRFNFIVHLYASKSSNTQMYLPQRPGDPKLQQLSQIISVMSTLAWHKVYFNSLTQNQKMYCSVSPSVSLRVALSDLPDEIRLSESETSFTSLLKAHC